jgi:AcrR family transcriptional regulator
MGGKYMVQPEIDMKMRILLAAKSLFAKHGFEGTSVRRICEEAGANIALVSYYFGGKEKVFLTIFETFMPLEKISFISKQIIEPLESMRVLIEELFNFHHQDPEIVTIIRQEMIMNSPRTAIMSPYTLLVWKHLREILKKGKENAIFKFDSLDNTMFFVMGIIVFHRHSIMFEEILEEGEQSLVKFAQEAYDFILRGLDTTVKEG